jgi:hypothetical protein
MRIATFLIAGCVFAQVEVPSIGVMLDASGALRTVYGVAGNFTLGPPLEAVLDSLPGTASAVSANEGEIVVRRKDGSEVRYPLPGVTVLRAMSSEWVQAITPAGSYALRVEPGREALFALPAARAEVRRR